MIWITEWLCPDGHSLMLLAWYDTETDAQSILKRGDALFDFGSLPRSCRICGAGVRAETRPTRHFSIYSALEELAQRESRRQRDA